MSSRTTIADTGSSVVFGNDQLALGFSPALNGALVSIVDPPTGVEFLRDAAAPKTLFRLALRAAGSAELEWLDSRDASSFTWSEGAGGDGRTLVLACGGWRALRDHTDENIATTALWFVAFLVGLGLALAARLMARGGAAGRVAFVSYWVNTLAAGAVAVWIVWKLLS